MKEDTEPHLWPIWKLSQEEAGRFYRGPGRVTIAVEENNGLLGVVNHARCQTKEVVESARAQMRSDFPRAVIREGSMRGHYFCEDLPDAGWRQAWEVPSRPEARQAETAQPEPEQRLWPQREAEIAPLDREPDRNMER